MFEVNPSVSSQKIRRKLYLRVFATFLLSFFSGCGADTRRPAEVEISSRARSVVAMPNINVNEAPSPVAPNPSLAIGGQPIRCVYNSDCTAPKECLAGSCEVPSQGQPPPPAF